MGLDMFIRAYTTTPEPNWETKWDDWVAWNKARELAYWRKHPDLHGYIIDLYADGVDECQEIPLTADDIRDILRASEADELPHGVEGFWFGASQPEDKEDTRQQLERVLEAMARDPGLRVYYQASW